jgi:cell wall assembly regulator SMI1
MSTVQRAAGLTWKWCKPPVDNQAIDALERTLGVKFPPDFRRVIQRCHGGVPVERSAFHYEDPSIGTTGSGIGALMTLYPDDTDGILTTLRLLSIDEQLPDKVIPFADDGGGDMMCLDYREDPDHPKVVYWSHEEEKDKSIIFLADTFTEFLAMLKPPEPLPERD